MSPEIQAPVLAVRICCASSVAALVRNERGLDQQLRNGKGHASLMQAQTHTKMFNTAEPKP